METTKSLLDAVNAVKEVALMNKAIAEIALKNTEAVLALTEQIVEEITEHKKPPLSLEKAAAQLGVTADMLKDRIKDGRFRHGVHYIDTSDGLKPNYLVYVSAVRKYLNTEPARRPMQRSKFVA